MVALIELEKHVELVASVAGATAGARVAMNGLRRRPATKRQIARRHHQLFEKLMIAMCMLFEGFTSS